MKASLISALVLQIFLSGTASAQIKLPQIISDGMVLQREQNNRIWGWSSAKEEISLKYNGKKYRTTADHAGNWEITLPPQAAGGPFDLTLKGKNEIVLRNILFGDVWFCSGQSNMVTPMERVKEKYPGEIANAQFPEIRNFFIATVTDLHEARDDLPSGKWMAANPQDVLAFG
ncbi:MAG: hypothetical protein R6W31_13755, partial [Bacteroidales bacterium]